MTNLVRTGSLWPARRIASRARSSGTPASSNIPRPCVEETIWPVIDYADIEAGTVPDEALRLLRRRGCLIVRGHFGLRPYGLEQALDFLGVLGEKPTLNVG